MKEVEHDGQLHPVVRGQFCEEQLTARQLRRAARNKLRGQFLAALRDRALLALLIATGLCEEAQLRLVAVDHGNPGPGTLPVATDGFAEPALALTPAVGGGASVVTAARRLLQDLPWPLLQARPHPLVLRTGTRRGLLLSFLRPRQHGEHLLGVRTWRATEYLLGGGTAATVAMRLRLRFSPLLSRVASLLRLSSLALRVAGRRSWRCMTTPLPSLLITSRSSVGARGSPAG